MTTAPAKAGWRFRQPSVIPGFGLTLGFSLAYLTLIILIPLSGLIWRSAALGWADFWAIASDRRTINALEISFGTAFLAAMVNVVFGTLVAWVLVRYRFPGRRVVDAMVDLPFALPTAVAGIALTALYGGNGWVGRWLEPLGLKIAWMVPNDFKNAIAAINYGEPVVLRAPRSEISTSLQGLASSLMQRSQSVAA